MKFGDYFEMPANRELKGFVESTHVVQRESGR
jgi:hypothetical protein